MVAHATFADKTEVNERSRLPDASQVTLGAPGDPKSLRSLPDAPTCLPDAYIEIYTIEHVSIDIIACLMYIKYRHSLIYIKYIHFQKVCFFEKTVYKCGVA